MNCEECDRLRRFLGVATDRWIKADNEVSRTTAAGRAAAQERATGAKIHAANQNKRLADHEATHSD